MTGVTSHTIPGEQPPSFELGPVPPAVAETLAETGSDTMILVMAALILLLIGFVCVYASSRKRRLLDGFDDYVDAKDQL